MTYLKVQANYYWVRNDENCDLKKILDQEKLIFTRKNVLVGYGKVDSRVEGYEKINSTKSRS